MALIDIETSRLRLRSLTADDCDAFVAYRRHPDVARFQDWDTDYGRDSAEKLIAGCAGVDFPPKGEWLQIAVTDKRDDSALVGDVAVHALAAQPDTYELGTTFDPTHQGKGFAAEAITAVVKELFSNHGAHRVFANCDGRNVAAQRVLCNLGFRHEGTAVAADWFKGEWTDLMTFALLATEWRAR